MQNEEQKAEQPTEAGMAQNPLLAEPKAAPLPWWEEHIKALEELQRLVQKKLQQLDGNGG